MPTKSKSSTTTSDMLPLVPPGEILLEEFMKPLGLSANALGLDLHVPANRILAIIKGERAITADTALRLSQYFGNSAEFWLNLQQNYELAAARRERLNEIQHEVLMNPIIHLSATSERVLVRHSEAAPTTSRPRSTRRRR